MNTISTDYYVSFKSAAVLQSNQWPSVTSTGKCYRFGSKMQLGNVTDPVLLESDSAECIQKVGPMNLPKWSSKDGLYVA